MARTRGGFLRPVSSTCGGIAMMQKVRNRGNRPMQRAVLNVESLEERTLLTGPSGVVTAMLNAKNGQLMLQGDAGNNSTKILASPLGGGLIRVSGVAFTSINGVTFTDFTLSSITSIMVN